MDDMTFSTKTIIEARWTLKEIEDIINYARMKIKPTKSRNHVLKKGKIYDQKFQAGDEVIPTDSEKPVKCLGKYFDDTLGDTQNVSKTSKHLDNWMKAVDKSSLPG
jgi:hypothetical protein